MALRREILSYVGTGAIGGIIGYYARARGLLGLQQEPSPRQSEQRSTSPTPEVITDPSETPRPETETQTPEVITDPPETPRPETETPNEETSEPSTIGALSFPFTETFQSGLNGWEVNHRYRTDPSEAPSNPSAGDGGYSNKYGGSVRLQVNGGPSTVGVGRQTAGIPAGIALTATVQVEDAESEPGNVSVAIFAPDGDDSPDERTKNDGDVTNGEIEVTHTAQQEYSEGAEIRVWADVWPGAFTAYVTRIQSE
jgi:hypothetical protein